MAKFKMLAFQKKKHETAFELYQEPDAEGRQRSNATIANMLGVSSSAVANWKKRDQWVERLTSEVDLAVQEADSTNQAIKKLLRDGLHRHISALNHIIANAKVPADKLKAIQAFVHIAKELEVLTPDTGASELAPPPTFKDDIPHAQPTDREGADGEGPSTGGPAGGPGGSSGDDPVYPLRVSDAVSPVESAIGLDGPAESASDDLEHLFRAAGL